MMTIAIEFRLFASFAISSSALSKLYGQRFHLFSSDIPSFTELEARECTSYLTAYFGPFIFNTCLLMLIFCDSTGSSLGATPEALQFILRLQGTCNRHAWSKMAARGIGNPERCNVRSARRFAQNPVLGISFNRRLNCVTAPVRTAYIRSWAVFAPSVKS